MLGNRDIFRYFSQGCQRLWGKFYIVLRMAMSSKQSCTWAITCEWHLWACKHETIPRDCDSLFKSLLKANHIFWPNNKQLTEKWRMKISTLVGQSWKNFDIFRSYPALLLLTLRFRYFGHWPKFCQYRVHISVAYCVQENMPLGP